MADYCIHIANVFYLMSYAGRDMLWLRAFTCCGIAFGIVFFTHCQSTPMYGPTFWHVAFLLINFYQIRRLLSERRRLKLSREQEIAGRAMLGGLNDGELADSLAHAVRSGKSGELEIFTDSDGHQLTEDEAALRDIAFANLSRAELMNLLSRRAWSTLKKLRPRWRSSTGLHGA